MKLFKKIKNKWRIEVEIVRGACSRVKLPLRGFRHLRSALWAMVFCTLLPLLSVASHAAEVVSVAVFDFKAGEELGEDAGAKATALLIAGLSTESDILTVERAELDNVLSEQELGLSGTIAPDTAARVGQLTGAKVIVTGRIFKVDQETLMVARIVGVETGRVFGEVVRDESASALANLSTELGPKIAQIVRDRSDVLLAKVESLEDRVKAINQVLGDRERPLVSVRITEQHFGRPVSDPAAQTELSLILQECGFTLVDEKSQRKPDIEITGEAFSELGLRKGNMVSCRSRIELKVQSRDGEIVAVDRQTDVAVDIAENIAAKTALQNAAAKLAERLLPKLVDQN